MGAEAAVEHFVVGKVLDPGEEQCLPTAWALCGWDSLMDLGLCLINQFTYLILTIRTLVSLDFKK